MPPSVISRVMHAEKLCCITSSDLFLTVHYTSFGFSSRFNCRRSSFSWNLPVPNFCLMVVLMHDPFPPIQQSVLLTTIMSIARDARETCDPQGHWDYMLTDLRHIANCIWPSWFPKGLENKFQAGVSSELVNTDMRVHDPITE